MSNIKPLTPTMVQGVDQVGEVIVGEYVGVCAYTHLHLVSCLRGRLYSFDDIETLIFLN